MNDIDNDWYYEPEEDYYYFVNEELEHDYDDYEDYEDYLDDPYENEPIPLEPQDTEGIEDL